MCYAKPGPRCSTHAKQSLDKATVAATAAEKNCRAVGDQCTRDGVDMAGYYLPEHPVGAAMAAERDAREAVHRAREAYDATPEGIKALKEQMAALEDQWGNKVLTVHAYGDAKGRLERGQQTRRDQMDAYKQVHQATPWAHQHATGDTAEAETEAMSPPPKCSCITYRYQSDCEHISGRTEQTRKDLLPTSTEASLRLHAANSRQRTLQPELAKWQAWLREDPNRTIDLPGLGALVTNDAREANPEFAAYNKQYEAAQREAHQSEQAFYNTPAGQTYLRQRSAAAESRMGYATGSTQADFARAIEGDEERIASRAEFTKITGQPAPAEEQNPQPPTLMYGNGCPENCNDFAWTGKCADTDTDMKATRDLQNAFSGMSQIKQMGKAMDKAFNPKPTGGRIARLLGRGRTQPAPTQALGMSAEERNEYAVRMEYRIRKAHDALDDETALALRRERDKVLYDRE